MQTTTSILHARSRHHEWQGVGPLSIKTFRGGQAHYSVEGSRHLVDDSCYLLLNAGQEYAITVDAVTPVESFCLFFATGFAEEVYYSLTTPDAQLLDNPLPPLHASVGFYERTYPHDALLSPTLSTLRAAYRGPEKLPADWLDEQLHDLMQGLLILHQQTQRTVAALPAARAATRAELYQRLYRARDYMIATFDQPLMVSDMAAMAGLSPNHFLRTFKQVFHQTPHQYLLHHRLQRAAHWLRTTDRTVTTIGLDVGFESLGSFSWRFRQHFGQAPEHYRRANR